jgi:TRAP-type C4-dicarboxylate transport system permease small subunit
LSGLKDKKNLINTLLNLDYLIAAISLLILVVVTFMGVIMRYFANNPIIWQEEVQLWCMVWIVFIGASAAVRTGGHIAIDFIVDLMPEKIKTIVEYLGYIIFIAVLIYLFIQGNVLVKQLSETGRRTNILRVPYSLIYGVMPLGCVLMIINQIIYVAKIRYEKLATKEVTV